MTEDLSGPEVTNEVFEAIAALCACRMPGIVGLAGLSVERAKELLRDGEMVRGVKVTTTAEDIEHVTVELRVEVSDRIPIPQIAATVQADIKQSVEEMTGHVVTAVHVTVDDIQLEGLPGETDSSTVDISQAVEV